MTYLQPHSRPYQRLARVIAGSIGVVAVICTIIIIFAPHLFSSLFTSIARPFWRVEFSIASGSLSSPEHLLADNERLKRELDELRAVSESVEFVSTQNEELKAVLGRPSNSTLGTSTDPDRLIPRNDGSILGAVLKRPPTAPYDMMIIDVGHDQGISTTSMVYATGNILIGRVVDVLSNTSKVKLFSSPEEKYDVLIGSSQAPAVAIGRGGGHYEAQVSRESGVKEGDYVISPGLNDGPFGTVSAVIFDPAQPFQTVLFSPAVNIYKLRWVTVKN
jgi:cell shape-determining protein MreC